MVKCEICGKELKEFHDIYTRCGEYLLTNKPDLCCSALCLVEKMNFEDKICVTELDNIINRI